MNEAPIKPPTSGALAATRWTVRDVVTPEIQADMDQMINALIRQGDSHHAELSYRLDAVALFRCPIAGDAPLAVQPHSWIIVPPRRDPYMQKRAWNFWEEVIDSMDGATRPSTRTMIVRQATYLAAGTTPISSLEFFAFDCTVDELLKMQRRDTAALRSAQFLPMRGREAEQLTLPLELARQLRIAHRVAELRRDEFNEWLAHPPHDHWPIDHKDKPEAHVPIDAWCAAIGAGIEQIILDDVLQPSSTRNTDTEPISSHTQPTTLGLRFLLHTLHVLRRLNRPYDVVQRAVRRKHAKLLNAPLPGGAIRQFITVYVRSFIQGLHEGTALFFAPLTALRRAVQRALRRRRHGDN